MLLKLSKDISIHVTLKKNEINHTIYFNEDANKMLLKLSKDISIHVTLKKNEVSLL